MRQAVRALVIHDGKLLVMHRNKFGKAYDTLPGGNVEVGENHEGALYRELLDETSLEFKNPRLVIIEDAGSMYGIQHVYQCDYLGGEPKLHPESEEYRINAMGHNLYEPRWLPLNELGSTAFVSDKLKQAILSHIESGFGPTPVQIR